MFKHILTTTIGVILLLSYSDAHAGDKSFRKCVACHTVEENGKNKMGPNLWDIFNRGTGKAKDYKYSKKFAAWAKVNPCWTPALMDQWLTKSKSMVKGTKMNFREKKPERRKETIEFLRSAAP